MKSRPRQRSEALGQQLRALARQGKAAQRRGAGAIAARARANPHLVGELRALAGCGGRAGWLCAWILSRIDGALDLSVAPAVLAALGADDADIRWAAAGLIVRLGNAYPEDVVPRLCMMAEGRGAAARKMALYCIRDLDLAGERVSRVGTRALDDNDAGVRLAALAMLARAKAVGSAQRIATCLLSDARAGVRRAAASALGRIGNGAPRVVAALSGAAAQKSDPALRRAALRAIGELARNVRRRGAREA